MAKAKKAKTKRTAKKRRPKRRVGIAAKLANASSLVVAGIEDTQKLRRKKRYQGIGEG